MLQRTILIFLKRDCLKLQRTSTRIVSKSSAVQSLFYILWLRWDRDLINFLKPGLRFPFSLNRLYHLKFAPLFRHFPHIFKQLTLYAEAAFEARPLQQQTLLRGSVCMRGISRNYSNQITCSKAQPTQNMRNVSLHENTDLKPISTCPQSLIKVASIRPLTAGERLAGNKFCAWITWTSLVHIKPSCLL
jgi:hypothetical protein